MSIRQRVLILIAVIALALTAALYILLEFTALQRFDRLEESLTRKQVVRVRAAVQSIHAELADMARDYAVWDQTYEFSQRPTQEYIDSNLSTSCESLRINLALVVDLEGRILYATAFDRGTEEYLEPPADLLTNPEVKSRLFKPDPDDGETGGIILLPDGPMAVGAVAIRPAADSPLIGGVVVFGKYIDEETVAELESQQQAAFSISLLPGSAATSRPVQALLEQGADSSAVNTEAVSSAQIKGYAVVADLAGKPALLLTVTEERMIHQQRMWVAKISIVGLAVLLSLFSWLLLASLESMLIKPLSRFVGEVKQAQIDSGPFELVQLTEQGPDETRQLARAVNHLLDRIQLAQQAVVASQQRFQSLADNVPVMIWSSDADLKLDYINHDFQEFTGADVYADATDLLQLVHADDRDSYLAEWDAAVLQRSPLRREVRLKRADGEYRWALVTVAALFSETGELAGHIGTALDITERKQGEKAVVESEARLRAITNSAQDAIIMLDSQGRISFWNPAAEKILGYSEAQALGRQVHELIAPEGYHESYINAFTEYQRTGQDVASGKVLELKSRRRDGLEIWVALSLSAVQIGGDWHTVGMLRDETERRMVQQELRETNIYLQDAIASANTLAAEAEMANSAKSAFLATMSHEIRTPLNGVIGMLELLEGTELTADQRDLVGTATFSADSLLSIINDILDFSKIEARRVELEVIDFNLRYVLESSAETLGAKAFQHGLELLVQIEPGVPLDLRGDPGRLRQVLLNLLGNALKFTEEGEVVVKASALDDTPEQALIRFEVKDTGIGIPPDRLHLLFKSFSQVDASTTRRYGGTGLGLAICQQLVEMMQGQIGVDSAPGQGSTFWFTARFPKQLKPAELKPVPHEALNGLRLLVVDDNSTNLSILEHQLRDWGCDVALTTSSEQGLEMLRSAALAGQQFQLAIVDLQMPGMNGESFARAVKAEALIREIHLVLMTSSGQRGDADQMFRAGFSAYLVKPVKQALLNECLLAVLGAAQAPAASQLITRHTLSERKRRETTILLAEDNPVNLKVARRMLDNAGYQVLEVGTGQAAVEAVQYNQIDLVLMDIHMPELDGCQATEAIRALGGRWLYLPIVAMTANVLPEEVDKCRQSGMNGYLSKPVKSQELYAEIERQLANAAPGSVLEPAPADNVAGEQAPAPAVPVQTGRQAAPGQMPPQPSRTQPDAMELQAVELPADLAPTPLDIPNSIRQAGDAEFWRELITVYLDETTTRLHELQVMLKAGNTALVVRQAHTIKGGSAELAAENMRVIALAIEQAAKAGDLDSARRLFSHLEAAFTGLREEVQAYLAEHPEESP